MCSESHVVNQLNYKSQWCLFDTVRLDHLVNDFIANLARCWVVEAEQRGGVHLAPAFIPCAGKRMSRRLRTSASNCAVAQPRSVRVRPTRPQRSAQPVTRAAATIRIDAVWLAVHPIDRHVDADPRSACIY